MAAIKTTGLREVRTALRKVDKDIPRELQRNLLLVAKDINEGITHKLPWRTGTAARSLRERATQTGASIAFGGMAAPYFPWLDFGGSTGRGHRPGAAWSGSVKRDWMGRPGNGRYVYVTIEEKREDIADAVQTAVVKSAESAQFEVR
jgi:hypothetical protein